MKKLLLIAMTLTLFFACQKKDSIQSEKNQHVDENTEGEDLIIGGHTVTKKNEIAATTVSLIDTKQGTLCTASILSDDIALTAAHCVDSGDPSYMQLSFGTRSSGNVDRSVEEYSVNPRWALHQNDGVNTGDIALVKFSGGLPKGIIAATLMKGSQHLSDGQTVTLAGFGESKIGNSSSNGAGKLRTVDVKIEKAKFSQTEVSIDQTSGKGACHGDSGGPAFIQNSDGGLLLWGVTSRGNNDPTDSCKQQSLYTRIQPYNRWINSVTCAWHK